jgi:hypothetical protein
MTPKEKARQIVIQMQLQNPPLKFEQAKHCALIAVYLRLQGDFISIIENGGEDILEYYIEVKKEIEKL